MTLICTSADYKCVQLDSLQVKEGRQLFDKSFCTGRDYSQYKVDNVYICTCRTPPRDETPSGVALSIATASQSSTSFLFSRSLRAFPLFFLSPPSFPFSFSFSFITNKGYNQTSTLRCNVTISTIELSIVKRIRDR